MQENTIRKFTKKNYAREKPVKCNLCDKMISDHGTGTLIKHLKVHTEEKPFQCKVLLTCICTYPYHFLSASNLSLLLNAYSREMQR